MEEDSLKKFEQYVKDGKFDEKCILQRESLYLLISVYDNPCMIDGKEFKGNYLIEFYFKDLGKGKKYYMNNDTILSYDEVITIIKSIMR